MFYDSFNWRVLKLNATWETQFKNGKPYNSDLNESIWSPHCQGNTFLLQPSNVQYMRDGSRQLLAEGLHRVAGHVLRTWLHELVFHLPQNLGCQCVEGHAQHCLQDACCHLWRRRARKDKLNIMGKLYYLQANDTCFISTSSLQQSFTSTFSADWEIQGHAPTTTLQLPLVSLWAHSWCCHF